MSILPVSERIAPWSAVLALVLGIAACSSSPSRMDKPKSYSRAAEANVTLGIAYMQQGNLSVADEKLRKALREDPSLPSAHWSFALLQMRLDNPGLAEKHFREALKLDPDDSMARNNFGVLLCDTGRVKEAEEQFLKAVSNPLYKDPASALTNAGLCALKNGKDEKAESYFRKALDKNPQYAPALYQMAELMHRKGRDLQARAFMKRYELVWKHDSKSLLLGYQIEKALSNRDGAATYAGALWKQYPDSSEARMLRGGAGDGL